MWTDDEWVDQIDSHHGPCSRSPLVSVEKYRVTVVGLRRLPKEGSIWEQVPLFASSASIIESSGTLGMNFGNCVVLYPGM